MELAPIPRLRTAVESGKLIEYSTGGAYIGQIDGNRKKGFGTFHWPTGAVYEGEFFDNHRQGHGKQTWPDGSVYEGLFLHDLRHGQGKQMWIDGSTYSGSFFRDRRHGKGTYIWSDGSTFTGSFYADKREGLGKFNYSNGNIFEGLYKKDERFGPGKLIYKDGHQDIGVWLGDRIIKILSQTPESFTMKNHLDLQYNPMDHINTLVMEDRYYNKTHVLESIIHPPKPFLYEGNEKLELNSKEIFNDSLHPDSLAMDCEIFETEFFKDHPVKNHKEQTQSVALNATPLLIEIQKYIHRHNLTTQSVPYEKGPRSEFKAFPGVLEQSSTSMIEACLKGNADKVKNLLISGEISPDVGDASGFTPLHAAVADCYKDIVNNLLDFGADINKLNDEGLSALAQCFVYYYPVDTFKNNIAEYEYLIKKNINPTQVSPKQNPIIREGEANEAKDSNELFRDSGFESRKDIKLIVTQNDPSRSSISPETRASHDRLTSKSPSDRDLTPSAVSLVTEGTNPTGTHVDASEMALGNDGSDEEETQKIYSRLSSAFRMKQPEHVKNKVNLIITIPSDGLSEVSSRTLSQQTNHNEEFQSNANVMNLQIEVSKGLVERCATALSQNDMVTKRLDSAKSVERLRLLARQKAMKNDRWEIIQLLLRRGANPNVCCVPMPALVFTIKAGDIEATKLLLLKGADANLRLPKKKGGLSPLHLAAGTPGEEGILITEYLLNALSDPDARATEDNSYLDPDDEENKLDMSEEEIAAEYSGGRTPLHIACSRDTDYENAAKIVHLLLDHKANPDLLCNGHSPLSLAIISGNDLAIEELLKYKANPSLRLTHSNGNALCVASHTAYEHRRSPDGRIKLIDKLVNAGADILAQVPIGPKRLNGTALDYAYHIFNLDRRIAHMPYHALSYSERETYNSRRRLLGHMGDVVREKCIARERKRLEEELIKGIKSRSPSGRFLFTGSGARPLSAGAKDTDGRVKFELHEKYGETSVMPSLRDLVDGVMCIGPKHIINPAVSAFIKEISKHISRRPLFKFCYECGRSINVRLTPCTRCKEVYYCSKNCKVKSWAARHKDECIRMQGSKSTSRAASNVKSAPAKTGTHKAGQKNLDPKAAAKLGKSYNMMRRPTDNILVGQKANNRSLPLIPPPKNRNSLLHGFGGMQNLIPVAGYMDNYSFE